ncbi:MAG: dihydropteroate synthase, partial [Alphaproteobacteria bacterium]
SAITASARLYVAPVAFATGDAARALVERGAARPLAGGASAVTAAEVAVRAGETIATAVAPVAEFAAWNAPGVTAWLDALAAAPPSFAGAALPAVVGIVNVTPDSFSDGGAHPGPSAAIEAGLRMWQAGAGLVDVGGESTRPGAAPVAPEEELRRVLPVVEGLAGAGVRVSVDTRRAAVMAAALDAGAAAVNDVSALAGDPQSAAVVAAARSSVILMHMQGEPATMQQDPRYRSAAHDVHDALAARLVAATAAGIAPDRIAIDPGIGFGKRIAHNLAILRSLAMFVALGRPVMVGLSRKGFIGRLGTGAAPADRLGGSIAGALWALARGASLLRVHDVAATVEAVALWRAFEGEGAAG